MLFVNIFDKLTAEFLSLNFHLRFCVSGEQLGFFWKLFNSFEHVKLQ